jgi:hypothetical protein
MTDASGGVRDPQASRAHEDEPPGMPRWVKVLGLVLLAVLLAGVLAMLVGDGDHGPCRHGARGPGGAVSPVAAWQR